MVTLAVCVDKFVSECLIPNVDEDAERKAAYAEEDVGAERSRGKGLRNVRAAYIYGYVYVLV